MLRVLVRGVVACLCALATVFAIMPIASANAATLNRSSAASLKQETRCLVLHVYLHGTQPATSECLESTLVNQHDRVVSHNISLSGCSSANLRLYEDINRGGSVICFSGRGDANLADYNCGLFCSWDNRASSYSLAGLYVGFYKYANLVCPCYGASPPYTANFTGSPVGNDELSSIALY